MTATVRRVNDNEFFSWLDLYAGYGSSTTNPSPTRRPFWCGAGSPMPATNSKPISL